MNDRSLPLPAATPVKRAYEQVAAQMRQWIVTGFLGVGDKLPSEADLCVQFGTSRSTVREALRLLASERLITTQPGAHGGSVVSRPSAANVSDDLTISLATLVGASDLSIAEMVQMRLILEVPAAGIAAAKCGEAAAKRLSGLVPDRLPAVEDLFSLDFAFHQELLESTGNRLLPIVALPVFEVSARRVPRHRLDQKMWQRVVDEHRAIVNAIAQGDSAAAEKAMRDHLSGLAASYEVAMQEDRAASDTKASYGRDGSALV